MKCENPSKLRLVHPLPDRILDPIVMSLLPTSEPDLGLSVFLTAILGRWQVARGLLIRLIWVHAWKPCLL